MILTAGAEGRTILDERESALPGRQRRATGDRPQGHPARLSRPLRGRRPGGRAFSRCPTGAR